jgi:hypothetical protein
MLVFHQGKAALSIELTASFAGFNSSYAAKPLNEARGINLDKLYHRRVP